VVLASYDFSEYIDYLVKVKRPDFIFETLLYLFARFNLNIHILFFLISSFVVFTVFYIVRNSIWKDSKNINIFYTLIIFFSFSLPGLLSGIRFVFGVAWLLWGVYFYIIKNKKSGLFFILLAFLTHFSTLFFVPAIILIKYKDVIRWNFYYLYLFSLVFLFLPSSLFISLLGTVNVSEGYNNKIQAYTEGGDFVSGNLQKGIANQIIYYTRVIWIFVAYLYLLFNKKYNKNALITQLLFLFLFFLNLTYSIPTVYSRYLNVVKIVFVLFILHECYTNIKFSKKTFWIFFILFGVSFLMDLYLIRYNLQASLLNKNLLTIVNILSNKFTLQDVLYNQ